MDFGGFWEASWLRKWSQDRTKIDSKFDRKKECVKVLLKTAPGRLLEGGKPSAPG